MTPSTRLDPMGLGAVLDRVVAGGLTLRLFIDPELREPVGVGYKPKRIASTKWDVRTGPGMAKAIADDQVFRFTGRGPTILGWQLQLSTGRLLQAQHLPKPFDVLRNGDQLIITPELEIQAGVIAPSGAN